MGQQATNLLLFFIVARSQCLPNSTTPNSERTTNMPPKLQVDESFAFLFMCIEASGCKVRERFTLEIFAIAPVMKDWHGSLTCYA